MIALYVIGALGLAAMWLYLIRVLVVDTVRELRRQRRQRIEPGPTSPLNETRRWQAAGARTYERQPQWGKRS